MMMQVLDSYQRNQSKYVPLRTNTILRGVVCGIEANSHIQDQQSHTPPNIFIHTELFFH